ncbi:MAG: shikimate kinase [Candidatus Hadarchaeota archaeon]
MKKMMGEASAFGSATVVNAFAAGKGAAFGIDLKVRANVRPIADSKTIKGKIVGAKESPKLIEICARRTMEHLGARGFGADVETRSEIPIAVGLSSSSAAANAVVMATFSAFGRRAKADEVLNIGIDSAFDAGVTLTGAFDDAAASLYGYGVVTDNLKRRVLKRFKVDPRLKVLVHAPPFKTYTRGLRKMKFDAIRAGAEAAHGMAMSGDIWGAMTLNGLLYSSALGQDAVPAIEALAKGAMAAGLTGTGPATVAVASRDIAGEIAAAWMKRPGKVIITSPAKLGGRTVT